MSKSSTADRYWAQFLQSLPESRRPKANYLEFFYFGSEPAHGGPVGNLVLAGTKRAGADILWRREASDEPPIKVGDLSIFHDGFGTPMGIIESTSSVIVPFNEVGSDYAQAGGEWDGTLENWREHYWNWIVMECQKLGCDPVPNIPMICERFKLIYSQPLSL